MLGEAELQIITQQAALAVAAEAADKTILV
jgi:hypothetical protein